MGPLVPYIISNEFNLIIAFIIGIAFGFILEQAGFSSTKKLVGLFYGYDFTVLRVFFTAGVTAMVGVLLMSHYGLLDTSIIYVNPTFVRSAIVGGLIMGAGFIIGGFCPGTSVCAAAIGKMDAMLFIGGSIMGIFVFAEVYPSIKGFYTADALGPLRFNEVLGISPLVFAFLLTSIAILAFYFTWKIEKKVRKTTVFHTPIKWVRRYWMAASVPLIVILALAVLPSKPEIIQNKIAEAKRQKKCVFKEMAADRVADEIVNHYYHYNVIDVRSPEEFEAFHLPMAINIPFDEITERKWETYFKQTVKTNIFYADDSVKVRMSCLKAKFIGKSDNYVMRETAQDFKKMFYELQEPGLYASKQMLNEYNFRSKTAKAMDDLTEALKNIGKPVTTEVKVASGGCS